MKHLRRFALDENGEGAIEYGLLACMISCFILGALQKLGTNMSGKFRAISTALS